MEPNTPIDVELQRRAAAKRSAALELLARTKPISLIAAQIPVWFALASLALIAAVSYKVRLNPAPYIAVVLIPTIGFIAGCLLRMQRRMEALVQLVVHERAL